MPENYRLYEHVKFTVSEITGESFQPPSKHAEGFDNYQDAYLYGHPQGRKKRYRSPADFFPHVLWLATDETGDPNNCTCKICAPEDIQVFDKPSSKVRPEVVKKEEVQVKKENIPSKPGNLGTYPMVVIPNRSLSQEKVSRPVQKPVPLAAPNPTPRPSAPLAVPAPPPAPSQPTPTFLDPPKCYEQDQDSHYNKYLFRPGELVWFNRGTAWGLAIITKRDLFKDQRHQDRPKYLLQPLSHPFSHPPLKIISQEDLLRPWLAWSAPTPTHQALTAAGLTFNSISWREVVNGAYGPGDAEVDGSIFAAKAIDESFTLIEAVSNNTVMTGERFYNGIFFGGEKIWVGEPIRLRITNGQDIMIVHRIVEKLKPGSTNASSASIHFVGDIYRFTTTPYTPGREPPDNRHLPARLRQDLDYRNRATMPAKRTISSWKISQAQARLNIADVKGRWYESSVLLPILRGAKDFTLDLRRGEIGDVGQWMNGRGDSSLAVGKPGIRHFERLEAFGRAVPQGTRISKGLDGDPAENVFPVVVEQQQQQQGQPTNSTTATGLEDDGRQVGVGDGDIAEFMNLDRLEDGFVQQFSDAAGQYYGDGLQR